jgi:uncharacterized membrane protein (UPF0127 family)
LPQRRRPTLLDAARVWRISVARTEQPLALRALVARTWQQRMTGLLGHAQLADGEALIFPGCNSIHTVGMRFAIDAVFVDRSWSVVALRERLTPGHLVAPVWSAWAVVETADGSSRRAGVRVGDRLLLVAGTD